MQQESDTVKQLHSTQPGEPVRSPGLLIEVGWIVAGKLDSVDRRAVELARERVQQFLQERLPAFEWRMSLEWREEMAVERTAEPVLLLDAGVVERNYRHWDYSIVITNADLVSYYKTDAIAAISRSLEGAVISTLRIDPRAESPRIDAEERVDRLARRIETLVLHAVGHHGGLGHRDDPDNVMFGFETVTDLDRAENLTPEQLETLERDLLEVADPRLEEATPAKEQSSLRFYLRASRINRSDIWEALVEARPWLFPYRFSRLTTAAVSAMMILIVTAEAWDLGMSQTPWFVTLFSFGVILFTTFYSLFRQKLFVRRERNRLTEQNVVTNVSTFSIVFIGMTTTYALLFVLTLVGSLSLFTSQLADNWTTAFEGAPAFGHYLRLSAFVASLGLFIGALGASFEAHSYFRHVTFVDEEL